jgi:hypothetical protein
MKRIQEVVALEGYDLRITFDDGVSGVLHFDQEPMTGVFARWKDPLFFSQVRIGDRGRTLVWPEEIDLCADSLWVQVTSARAEAVMPGLVESPIHA